MERVWHKFYQEGVPPAIDYPDITIPKFLENTVKKYPDNIALTFFGKKLDYRKFYESVNRFATALSDLGIKKGDKFSILLPNCPQFVIAYFAANKIGAINVNTNPLYVERELIYQLNDSGSETILCLDLLYPRVKKVKEKTNLKTIIVTPIKDYLPFPLNLLYPIKQKREGYVVKIDKEPGVYLFKDLLNKYPPSPPEVETSPGEIALLQYTGGTTGISKGCILTHKNLIANTLQCESWFVEAIEGKETCLCALPFFHVFGMTVAMLYSVRDGYNMILMPKFEVESALKLIKKHKPTIFPGVPAMYAAINYHPDVEKYDLSSIKYCISGAAPLPVEICKKFEELTGAKLVEGYGLTETSPVTHCNPFVGLRKIGSIGVPFPDTDAKIMDIETGENEMLLGESGELAIFGPQVMKGYWNKPEETKNVLREGWCYTGDIAKIDDDGFFYIVDRKKDMIISGGFNIYPREVEEVLYEHPKVREAAVIGVPDTKYGESVKAFISVKEGEELTEEEIIQFCKENLAKYKIPRSVEFRDEMPKSLVGKVLKRVLVEEELKKIDK